jgi:hypothetical protein
MYCRRRLASQHWELWELVRRLAAGQVLKSSCTAASAVSLTFLTPGGCRAAAGYRAAGDAEALQRLGRQYGLAVEIVELVNEDDGAGPLQVSSSRVRLAPPARHSGSWGRGGGATRCDAAWLGASVARNCQALLRRAAM